MGAVAYTNAKPSILKSHSWDDLSITSLEIQYSFSCHDHINFAITFTLPHPQPFQWLTSSAVSSRTSEVALASHQKPTKPTRQRRHSPWTSIPLVNPSHRLAINDLLPSMKKRLGNLTKPKTTSPACPETETWTNLQILVHWQTHLSHVSRPQYPLPRSLKRSCHFLLSYHSAGQKTAAEAW